MPGVSGARVSIHQGIVCKSAPEGPVRERLHAQYRWLLTHKHYGVVNVNGWNCGGYTMERLSEPSRLADTAMQLCVSAERLWLSDPEVRLDVKKHEAWVKEKIKSLDLGMSRYVRDGMHYVLERERYLKRCLTHGDLTRVNLMTRAGSPVLIDPIPATPACADVWAFDVSKIVVSLLGYEHIMYKWPAPGDEERKWLSSLLMQCNPVELECVRYMAAVQVGRLLPYHPKEMWLDLHGIADQAICIRP